MDAPPFVSEEDLAATPPSVIALLKYLFARIEKLEKIEVELAATKAELAELKASMGIKATPANSSKPPSSSHPHDKPIGKSRDKNGLKRKRGGQQGHKKHERALIPADDCNRVVPVVPSTCRRCGDKLFGVDPEPIRHQVWELPEIKPTVVEYQRHRIACRCGCSTCGELPVGVPTGQAGPRLVSFTALLMACFRQSKRRAALFLQTILNVPASSAWMVKLQNLAAAAVKPAYDELIGALHKQKSQNIDESPTKEGKKKSWVWTFVTKRFTAFVCRTSRAAEVLKELLGEAYKGIVGCDRARMYFCLGPKGRGRLQWCWAHLIRDFQALIDDPCSIRNRLGHDLMRATRLMFELWQKVRDGTLTHRRFRIQMKPIRQKIDSLLLRGYLTSQTRSTCKELVKHKDCLWTFVDVKGIEPTNNGAEQALRHAVIWRKLSFGTQSEAGSRFVERLLTVVETCRRQKRNAFEWLVRTIEEAWNKRPTPSLLHGV